MLPFFVVPWLFKLSLFCSVEVVVDEGALSVRSMPSAGAPSLCGHAFLRAKVGKGKWAEWEIMEVGQTVRVERKTEDNHICTALSRGFAVLEGS